MRSRGVANRLVVVIVVGVGLVVLSCCRCLDVGVGFGVGAGGVMVLGSPRAALWCFMVLLCRWFSWSSLCSTFVFVDVDVGSCPSRHPPFRKQFRPGQQATNKLSILRRLSFRPKLCSGGDLGRYRPFELRLSPRAP